MDIILGVLDSMQPTACAQGENDRGRLLPPVNKDKGKLYSKVRIRSKFQAADGDTSGVDPRQLRGKKRRRGDGDAAAFHSVGHITEIGTHCVPLESQVRDEHRWETMESRSTTLEQLWSDDEYEYNAIPLSPIDTHPALDDDDDYHHGEETEDSTSSRPAASGSILEYLSGWFFG